MGFPSRGLQQTSAGATGRKTRPLQLFIRFSCQSADLYLLTGQDRYLTGETMGMYLCREVSILCTNTALKAALCQTVVEGGSHFNDEGILSGLYCLADVGGEGTVIHGQGLSVDGDLYSAQRRAEILRHHRNKRAGLQL